MNRILKLVDKRMSAEGNDAIETEKQLDEIISKDLYRLNIDECRAIGLDI